MSVDKFGRYSECGANSRCYWQRSGGFTTTPDISTEPRSSRETTLKLEDNHWNALNVKISKVKEGEVDNDVATLGQTLTRKGDKFWQKNNKYQFLELIENKWNGKKRKITDVLEGEESHDVATMDQTLTRKGDAFIQQDTEYHFLELKDDKWDGKNKKIAHLIPGKYSGEAATVNQIPTIETDLERWNFNNYRLSNIAPGYDENDCVTKVQTLTLINNKFDAKDKQISNVCPGVLPNDAAVMSQILRYDDNLLKQGDKWFSVLTLVKTEVEDYWDAKYHRIISMPLGVYPRDICLMEQAVRYVDKKFVCGKLKFNLMEYNPKLVLADPTSPSGFKTLDGKIYIPKVST